jgi:hypothetical protein
VIYANELSEEEQQPYSALQENLTGLLTTQDIEHLAQLQLLGKLHDTGVLTDDEFEREKQQLLNS